MTTDQFWNLLAGCLITFGMAFSVSLTEGPFSLFSTSRKWIKKKAKRKWLTVGIQCPICVSFWIGLAVSACMGGGFTMWLSCVGFTAAITSLSPESSED